MNLERNIIDNILECEIKLGHASLDISFYYPTSSLTELLSCSEEALPAAIKAFQKAEEGRLGSVVIEELKNEKGRFGVTVPAEGVDWVYHNFKPSEFMKTFVAEITRPMNTLENIIKVFYQFSDKVNIAKNHDSEWAVSFEDESIDPYVYHLEENDFGLEYHRFTRTAYQDTILN